MKFERLIRLIKMNKFDLLICENRGEKDHLEILASASPHRHRHWHRHRHSNINIVFNNSLHVISNKVATYRLEACDFVRKCFAKISRKKFSDNLKRVTVKNPYEKTSVLESLFNEIGGINSRL